MKVFDTILKLLTDSLLNCTDGPFQIPPAEIFLSNLELPYIMGLIVGTVITMVTIALGVLHLMYISNYVTHPYRRVIVVFLAGTAPFVSALSLVAMFMPRTWFLAHLLSFQYFSVALYVEICLLMHIFEGRQSMVKKMNEHHSRITVQTPPFCCLFPCLPKFEMQSRRIRWFECMVLQTPLVRLACTVISLIIHFEYRNGGMLALKVLDFISLPSLLMGIYGTHILVTTVSQLDELIPYRYIVVFRLLDFYFMFFGVQHPIFDFVARAGIFGCGTVLPAIETSFFWKNLMVVLESFAISLISTILLKPSRSALFDKYPSCRSVASSSVASSIATRESAT